jgi:hypothetical protein
MKKITVAGAVVLTALFGFGSTGASAQSTHPCLPTGCCAAGCICVKQGTPPYDVDVCLL